MNQPVSHEHKHDHHAHSCCGSAAAPALVQLSEKASSHAQFSRFRIEAMDCPTEQTLIQTSWASWPVSSSWSST